MRPEAAEALADRAAAWFEGAEEALQAGRFDEALAGARRAARGFARASGRTHPDHANARNQVGRVLEARGDKRAALPHLRFAARSLARVRGGGAVVGEMAAQARVSLAALLTGLGRYPEARREARAALGTARRAGSGALEASALNVLGMIGKFSGRFADAERWYREARPLIRRLHGARSREMATLYHNLGGLEHARGRFARGEPPARRAVELARALLPAGDPERLAHEVAHAALLDGLGRHHESLPVYRRALAAFRRIYGPWHYEVASTLHNLAAVEEELGSRAAAARHYGEALRGFRRLLGRSHPDVGLTLHNLGALHAVAGRRAAAVRCLREARAIFAATVGPRHPHTRACAARLADLAGGG